MRALKNTPAVVLRAALVVVSAAVTVAVLEVGARIVYFQRNAPETFGVTYLASRLGTYVRARYDSESGPQLNHQAWESSYAERGLPVPPGGPREGYWGSKVSPKSRCGVLRWCEPETVIPGMVEIDARGFQYAEPSVEAKHRILIVGGSVAFGANASDIGHTYYSQLVDRLETRGLPAEVVVLAAGAWESSDELTALSSFGLDVLPDVVVFLNGYNDIAHGRSAESYVRNMRTARFLARERQITVVYTLQPFLPYKPQRSPLEKRIVESMNLDELRGEYTRARDGVRSLALEEGTYFIDTSEAFNGETVTTFADQCHFSDPAHAILADILAQGLAPILEQR